MFKLFKFLGLVSKGLLLQFTHVYGYLALGIVVAAGYYRLPSWAAPVLGVLLGVAVNYLGDVSDVKAMLAMVQSSDGSGRTLDKEEGGYLIFVYLVVAVVGYIVGGWARIQREKRRAKA
jgi:hypothetical protein